MFIIATANFFGWFTIFQRIPDALITQLTAMGASAAAFMWIVIAIILVLGCFLDGNAIFLITLPIFMKICPLFGVDMVNFGVVMTLLIMIGNLTPPVGMCLFAVESFAKIGVWTLALECLPYLVGHSRGDHPLRLCAGNRTLAAEPRHGGGPLNPAIGRTGGNGA